MLHGIMFVAVELVPFIAAQHSVQLTVGGPRIF